MSESARREEPKRIRVGSRVRIAQRLDALLRVPAERRPDPAQMLWAGREARVVGYRRDPSGRALWLLEGAPGAWTEDWLAPV